MTITACCSGGSAFYKEPILSEIIVGEWNGQVDVAQMVYQDLGEELGIELSPDPIYCDVQMIFDDDGSCVFAVDVESFALAVGKCVEPYTSAFFGVDTDFLVDMIMESVASDIPTETGVAQGQYEVEDENSVVYIKTDDGQNEPIYLDKNGCLEYEDKEIGQIIIFEKE